MIDCFEGVVEGRLGLGSTGEFFLRECESLSFCQKKGDFVCTNLNISIFHGESGKQS